MLLEDLEDQTEITPEEVEEIDYALKYPADNTPKEVSDHYISLFKTEGIEAEKDQEILNGLIKQEAEVREQNIINLSKSLNDEANSWKEELGAKYTPLRSRKWHVILKKMEYRTKIKLI
ncbi:hypothetical protein [Candidatus Liberibacter sp.]|uniref:hypothetical protein n=1 Tax=Candidatus Liberibacter sp. TaxID=34022 RepID=UPI0015F74579|nr:hypothetical protein [Candidatus Liberibacter sp.]MBA5724315.1 hypothetical protein [Candidatus Liberibacter sp.]